MNEIKDAKDIAPYIVDFKINNATNEAIELYIVKLFIVIEILKKYEDLIRQFRD